MLIGITGSFGTGKTTVAKCFKELGAEIIDADKIVHKLIKKDSDIHKQIVRTFGKGLISKEGSIERSKLAKVVFSKKSSLSTLCKIIHPVVIKKIKDRVKEIKKRDKDSLIVVDAPLLIEANLEGFVDKVLVVKTTRRTQIKRLKKKGFDPSEINLRLNAQLPLKDKLRLADFVICNEGPIRQTRRQVRNIYSKVVMR